MRQLASIFPYFYYFILLRNSNGQATFTGILLTILIFSELGYRWNPGNKVKRVFLSGKAFQKNFKLTCGRFPYSLRRNV